MKAGFDVNETKIARRLCDKQSLMYPPERCALGEVEERHKERGRGHLASTSRAAASSARLAEFTSKEVEGYFASNLSVIGAVVNLGLVVSEPDASAREGSFHR